MSPHRFDYVVPDSVEDALVALTAAGDTGTLLAGGQSALTDFRTLLARYATVIDIGRIDSLRTITDEDDHIDIGATATHDRIHADALVRRHAPLLHCAIAQVGDPQVRHRGTIGGAIVHADPAGDVGTAILTLDAELVIARGPVAATRTVAAKDFFLGRGTTSLRREELLTRIRVPKHTGWGAHYEKFVRVAHQWATVAAAATVRLDGAMIVDARVGLTNMGPVPLRSRAVERALLGVTVTDGAVRAAVESVVDATDPPSDINGDAEYRKHLARVLIRRAVLRAAV